MPVFVIIVGIRWTRQALWLKKRFGNKISMLYSKQAALSCLFFYAIRRSVNILYRLINIVQDFAIMKRVLLIKFTLEVSLWLKSISSIHRDCVVTLKNASKTHHKCPKRGMDYYLGL